MWRGLVPWAGVCSLAEAGLGRVQQDRVMVRRVGTQVRNTLKSLREIMKSLRNKAHGRGGGREFKDISNHGLPPDQRRVRPVVLAKQEQASSRRQGGCFLFFFSF